MGLGLDRIAAAAEAIAGARRAGKHLGRLPDNIRPATLTEGYRVQDAVHAILRAAGHGEVIGHKIGATTPVMQKYMDINHPCAGGVFEPTVYKSGVSVPYSSFRKVGLECEIAAMLGRDMRADEGPFDRESVARYVESYCAAIELVDDRYVEWQTCGTPTLAADDFFGAGSILGAPVAPDDAPDLAAAVGRAFVNGAEIAAGTGADVMGHPLEALAWLANHFAARGQMLRAGEFVSTGSMVKTIWLAAGDRIAIDVAGLGSVEAIIAAG